jgi:tRNA(Ser,Leu) C12 N-acetylase TAN1
MQWNAVVSIYRDGFTRALRALEKFGQVERSPYYNVLLVKLDDAVALLEPVERLTEQSPALYDAISRIAPAMCCFEFHSAEEFRERAESILLGWLPRLAGRSFHVRLHRRGAKHELSVHETERVLNDTVVRATASSGDPARISFTEPDAVIAIDIVDDRAGASLWTREDLARHRLLRPD